MNTAIISIVAPRNLKQLLLALLVLVVGVSALLFSGHFFAALGWVQHGLSLLFKNLYIEIFHKHLLSPVFWFVLGAALIIQTVSPAARGQRLFSIGMLQDLVWFVYEAVFAVFIFGTYVLWFEGFYARNISFLTVTTLADQPFWARFLVAVLLTDFLNWFHHLLLHRIPLLWKLHCVHHSQRELNFFTAYRFHALELVVRFTFIVLPFNFLALGSPTIVLYSFFERWYTRFYHANIRTNLGFLRHILVTPQSHRIHHSREVPHFNRNYGAVFSFWDRMFGTNYHNHEEYPETGIPDEHFPVETTMEVKKLLATPFLQMWYPFKPKSVGVPSQVPSESEEAVQCSPKIHG